MNATIRRHAAQFVAVVTSALAFGVLAAGSADASSVSLAGTAYNSKTYYSTPRYKAVTGQAGTTGVTWSAAPSGCGGGGLHTGFRNTPAYTGEVTNFPWNTGSVMYININQSPQYAMTFAAGTYYMTAQYTDQPSCYATWSGTLNW